MYFETADENNTFMEKMYSLHYLSDIGYKLLLSTTCNLFREYVTLFFTSWLIDH